MTSIPSVYHFVSHTHWDREWYLPFEQFRVRLVELIDRVLDTLHREGGFDSFLLDGQSALLDDFLEICPDRRHEFDNGDLGHRLLAGPWYILADEFLSSGESLVRNLAIGTRAAEPVGGAMRVGYLPDTFGHIAAMPSILAGFGIDSAVLYRGFGDGEQGRASEYWWDAPDGSRVLLAHLHRDGYSAAYFHHDTAEEDILARFARLKPELDARATTQHRLIMNGGDHHLPDEAIMRALAVLRTRYLDSFQHSSLPEFIRSVRAARPRLATVHGELRDGYTRAFVVQSGVYSARMHVKQMNWRCQLLLERYVEPLNALTAACGAAQSREQITHAWKQLLRNQAHDSICGCSIDRVHREMMTRYAQIEDAAAALLDSFFRTLFPPDPAAYRDDRSLILFNPSPFERSGLVETEVRLYRCDVPVGLNPDVTPERAAHPTRAFTLLDAGGASVPFQVLGTRDGYDITLSPTAYPRQTRCRTYRILLEAQRVPPTGFARIDVAPARRMPVVESRVSATVATPGGGSMGNGILTVRVSPKGMITLIDNQRKLRCGGLHLFEDGGDDGDLYSYSPPPADGLCRTGKEQVTVSVVEAGPLRAALRLRYSLRVPRAMQPDRKRRSRRHCVLRIETLLRLEAGSRLLRFETTVRNTARDHRLRVLFPTGLATSRSHADAQFCIVERERRVFDPAAYTIEHPAKVSAMQRFVGVMDEHTGVTCFTGGLPEYEVTDDCGTLAVTLLRCVGTLAGENLVTRPGGKSGWHNDTPEAQCQGTYTFRYALLLHTREEWERMELINACAEEFHLPVLVERRKAPAEGAIGAALARFSSGAAVPSAMKVSEDGRAIIVRWWNPLTRRLRNVVTVVSSPAPPVIVPLGEEEPQDDTPDVALNGSLNGTPNGALNGASHNASHGAPVISPHGVGPRGIRTLRYIVPGAAQSPH